MVDASLLKAKFAAGLSYADFVATGAAEGLDRPWRERYAQLALDEDQQRLVRSFTRQMHVLCLTGNWCGDCALQGSAMQRIAEVNPAIHLRFLGRNEHADLQVKVRINGGFRVPITFFAAEDFEPVSVFGDRTLSRYRSMARKALGEAAPVVAPPPADPVREVLREVLEEVERAHLILRLSTRLRQAHGD